MTRLLSFGIVSLVGCMVSLRAQTTSLPNILWITSEDNGPQLGCYGDEYATTPHLDQLAARGMVYLNVWSVAPVCAPARTAIISGMYPSSTGSEHMRSMTRLPDGMKMYPQYLREAGYYCSNNSKEDYNLEKPERVWHESSNKAHWKNRNPNQPFFAIFNHTVSHESQVRRRPHTPKHDPAAVPLPAYHPNTPEVRRDWAQYYDKLSEMDALAGANLRELEAAGLAEDTIVFYYGDHGAGMPRSKRWPYNSGLRVPLIVYIPPKFKHLAPSDYAAGGKTKRLVSFVDLAPTLLSIAGITPPDHLQGRAFMGKFIQPEPAFLHGLRGRMDERYDLVRSTRDQRFVYIRNYMPHKIYGQHINYMFQTPTTKIWKELYDAGKLRPPQTFFWETKPAEELYDLERDPYEVQNLVQSPEHEQILKVLRSAQQQHARKIRDIGFLPEDELHTRDSQSAPYDTGHSEKYPIEQVIAAAELAASSDGNALPQLKELMAHADSAVRHWAVLGILIRGQSGASACRAELIRALEDKSPYVRATAAEALGRYGSSSDIDRALSTLVPLANMRTQGVYVAMWALNAIDTLGSKAARIKPAIEALPRNAAGVPGRLTSYVPRLLDDIIAKL